jgi:hypothetical protein
VWLETERKCNQNGINCYITRIWVKAKSILDKELQKDSKVAGNLK